VPANPQDWGPGEWLQAIQATAWFNYCECIPGTPPPINYTEPTPVIPGNTGNPPSFVCNPADICASLSAIQSQIYQLASNLQATSTNVALLQRYGLPFGLVPSNFYMGLTGDGAIGISRLAGLQVDLQSKPPNTVELKGNPPYLIDMGWRAINDSNGMLAEKRITRDAFTWLPEGIQAATAFTYSLFSGVAINVRELKPEG